MTLNNVTVIGGGILGSQIGLMCANGDKNVTFLLRSKESIKRTKEKLAFYSEKMLRSLERSAGLCGQPMGEFMCPKGLIKDWGSATNESVLLLKELLEKRIKENIHFETDRAAAVKDADLVIETISEDPEAKAEMYESIKGLLPERTIIATNTSSLLPSMFADCTGRPEKYCGMHFSNILWYCNSAEIMGHPGTSEETVQALSDFAEEINMVPLILKKEQPGYLLNSLLFPFLGAAQTLWANDVADPHTIDRAWEIGMGGGTGPFKVLDTVGLDTVYALNQLVPDAHKAGTVWNRVGKLLKEKIDRGETGQTSGKGFYEY